MERKEILMLIAVCAAVCLLIAGIRAVRGEDWDPDSPSESSAPAATNVYSSAGGGGTTNYWDYLHSVNETTTTAAATDNTSEQTSDGSSSGQSGSADDPAQTGEAVTSVSIISDFGSASQSAATTTVSTGSVTYFFTLPNNDEWN